MNQSEGSQTKIEGLPGEQRSITSVNQNTSSTVKRAIVIAVLFICCALAGIVYWKYRRHAGHSDQDQTQKNIRLTSAIPTKTFTEPPAPPVTPIPVASTPQSNSHLLNLRRHQPIVPLSHTSKKSKPPQVLDKAGSSLMAIAAGPTQAHKSDSIDSHKEQGQDDAGMAKLLSGTSTPVRQAEQLINRNFVLAKGSFIDCALQTRLDSTVPGMTACVVTRHIYSDNGKVILIERGSTVSGEYKSNLRQGMARIFVLWTRIKTPSGVIVNLDSPGADQLGGSGVPGYVDNHFWQRFGGALLLSLVDDVAAVASSKLEEKSQGASFDATFNTSQDMATEALKSTINIPPTLYKNQGDQIGIYVARDLDFSGVYDVANH